jgi:uncharacterized protein
VRHLNFGRRLGKANRDARLGALEGSGSDLHRMLRTRAGRDRDVYAGCRSKRERITGALDRDRARDAAADAGAFGRASPLSPGLARVFGRGLPACAQSSDRSPLDYGIKDYDLAYFDASNLSYEAEDAVIRRMKAALDEPLRSMVEVRNQARVHLWFEAKFGEPYSPLSCTAEALERFTSATFAVGVRLEPDDRLHIEAPFGLADLFAPRLRPNPRRKTVGFARTAADVRRRWPELVVEDGS